VKNQGVMKLVWLGFFLAASVTAMNMQWPMVFRDYGWSVKELGYLFALVAIFNSLGSRLAPYFKRRHRQEIHALIFSQAVTAIGIIGSGLLLGPRITLALFLTHQVGRGLFAPLSQDLLNKSIEHANRATILSFASMINKFGNALGLVISGLIAKHYGIGPSWLTAGTILILGFGLMLKHHNRKSRGVMTA
jgi:MFS family permease